MSSELAVAQIRISFGDSKFHSSGGFLFSPACAVETASLRATGGPNHVEENEMATTTTVNRTELETKVIYPWVRCNLR
jgi:hypothetical protein